MFRQLKKNLVATLIAAMTIGQVAPAFADSADTLPDMGTSAGSTLSIGQEMQMGDYYVRQLRGSAPLINDPLLTQYINSLGMRLAATWCCTLPCSVIPITKVNWLQLWRTKSPTSPNVTWRERWKISSAARR